jgi:hypothetical protein
MSSGRSQLRLLVLIAAASCASLLCLFRSDRQAVGSAVAAAAPAVLASAQSRIEPLARRAPTRPLLGIAATPVPQSSAAPELEGHPHPITAEHVRIQRELQLIQQLNDALDLRDPVQMRPLLADYAREYPDDPNAMRAGYERIADCLERPGESTRAAAQGYYERERASNLRRYVRRICLE